MGEPAPRRSRGEMSEQTTAQLLAAARRAFATSGYAASAMDTICADAGVTRGALYHHFGGKEGLLEAVVYQIDAEISARLDMEEKRHADPWVGFRACCRLWLEQALDPEIQRICLRDAPSVLGQKLRDLDEISAIVEIRDSLAALMLSGRIRATDPEALARMINGALVDAALWVAAAGDQPGAQHAALDRALAAADVLLDGLERRD
ncbi:TetR/AcrR family transcriptional regulator [Yoonia vestfoldensis]|uniref:TetR/AcrR family transcriptional regulator n=1 Tax=Yoonia vestfoldensis TaxID=245188 RepID=UPI00036BCDD6|nr:TetR/AcrR family transcriptional regulator [Yoonia vestfoldensis]